MPGPQAEKLDGTALSGHEKSRCLDALVAWSSGIFPWVPALGSGLQAGIDCLSWSLRVPHTLDEITLHSRAANRLGADALAGGDEHAADEYANDVDIGGVLTATPGDADLLGLPGFLDALRIDDLDLMFVYEVKSVHPLVLLVVSLDIHAACRAPWLDARI
jgi:hypothetical protein